MKKVAVTGSLACGKSSVCHFFEELGAFVVSADVIVHQLLARDSQLTRSVIDRLGPEIVVEGEVNREELARRVFDDPIRLAQLEQLLHPAVRQEIEDMYAEQRADGQHPLFVVEIPLLFEAGMESDYDVTVAVISSEQSRRTRYAKPDFTQRASRQLSQKEKASRADYVLKNDGTLEELRKQTASLFSKLV